MSARRVVVTGLGATTPLGGDVGTTWSALLAGTSGVRLLTAGSKSSIFIVGGARRSCNALTIKTDSIAPAPPNKWPVMDFVAETAT